MSTASIERGGPSRYDEVNLGFLGMHTESVELTAEEWRGAGFPGTPEPMMLLGIDTLLLGTPIRVALPPFLINAESAAAFVAALTAEFDLIGMGAALTAHLDQFRAMTRDLPDGE